MDTPYEIRVIAAHGQNTAERYWKTTGRNTHEVLDEIGGMIDIRKCDKVTIYIVKDTRHVWDQIRRYTRKP